MKWIIAIIQPHRLEAVKQCLTEVEVFRLTVSDVQGYGRQRGHTEYFRGQPMQVNLIRKVRLDIGVNDNFVQPTINAIVKGARSGEGGKGQVGDGKIFIIPLENVVRISDGVQGGEAHTGGNVDGGPRRALPGVMPAWTKSGHRAAGPPR